LHFSIQFRKNWDYLKEYSLSSKMRGKPLGYMTLFMIAYETKRYNEGTKSNIAQ
jgi:hypothetical protein